MVRQERAVRTRQALIRSAAEVFDRGGYAKAKLADISAGAGVSQGALHFHFDGKEAIAGAVESAALRTLTRAAHIAYRERAFTLQSLADMSHAFADLMHWDVVVRSGFRLNNDSARSGDRGMGQLWHGCITRLLDEAAAAQELNADVQLPRATCAIVGATAGIGLLVTGDKESPARVALTGFWQGVLGGLATPRVLARLRPEGTDAVVAKAIVVSGNAFQTSFTPGPLAGRV